MKRGAIMAGRNILDALDLNISDLERSEEKYITTKKRKTYVDSRSTPERSSYNQSYEYKILEKFGSLSKGDFAPEFSRVDWSGSIKYDLRRWKKDGTPGKGVTFTIEELRKIKSIVTQNNAWKNSNTVIKTYIGESSTAKFYAIITELSSYNLKGQDWIKQVSVIDWGYGKKVDFHSWTKDYKKCSKGMCLSFDEFTAFLELVNVVAK